MLSVLSHGRDAIITVAVCSVKIFSGMYGELVNLISNREEGDETQRPAKFSAGHIAVVMPT